MIRSLFTAIFLTLFSQTAWGLTESEFSQALSVAKLDAAVLKVRDNCQSQIGVVETSRECKCAIHYANFANETAFSIQYERCLKVLAAEVDNKMLIASDRTYRVAADEAIRAVFKCSPFPEPENGFAEKTNFIFNFDPRFMY